MIEARSDAARSTPRPARRRPRGRGRPAPLVAALVGPRDEARRLRALLRRCPEGRDLRVEPARTIEDACELVATKHVDCLLVAAQAVEPAAEAAPDVALVGVVADDDPQAALAALRAGAQDCLAPERLEPSDLVRALRFAVERHRVQSDLRRRALHDPLTGLPNRELLLDRLEHALHEIRRDGGSVAVVFVDLDGFKDVNDRLGHHAGDAVLVEAARRLVAGVRPGDTVARYGGDEFAIVCRDAGRAELGAIVRRLSRQLLRPVRVEDEPVCVGASFGTAFAAEPDEPPAALLRRADAAMYAAKHRRHRMSDDLS